MLDKYISKVGGNPKTDIHVIHDATGHLADEIVIPPALLEMDNEGHAIFRTVCKSSINELYQPYVVDFASWAWATEVGSWDLEIPLWNELLDEDEYQHPPS